MNKDAKIFVAGHKGLLGSAIIRLLKREGYKNIITRKKEELDLRDQYKVRVFFEKEKPDYVFLVAAKVGGLQANSTYRAEFIYDNVLIQSNVIDSSWRCGVRKLIFIASNCMYPKDCKQPMREEYLMTGKFEPTNQPFAVAKICGMEMCQAYNYQYKTNFITVIPASLFGPGDNYDLVNSHIVPTLIRKCHEAKINCEKKVVISGASNRKRELIYVDDAAEAVLFITKNYNSSEPINIGINSDMTVEEIANSIKRVVGFEGEIKFDTSKPSGMMQKLLESSRIKEMGWKQKIGFEEGIKKAYSSFLEDFNNS